MVYDYKKTTDFVFLRINRFPLISKKLLVPKKIAELYEGSSHNILLLIYLFF